MKAKLQASRTKLRRNSNRLNGVELKAAVYPEAQPSEGVLNEGEGSTDGRHPFDLEERTACFGESVIRFAKKIPRGPNNNRLIDQLVGCSTSVGATYCEANEGVSKKDFHFIIGRCRKEAKETKFFLRMIAASAPTLAAEARVLFREAKEPHLIFCAMFRNSG